MEYATHTHSTDKQESSLTGGWKLTFLSWLRLTNVPTVRVYRGFGHTDCWHVQGHVFSLSPLARRKYRQNVFTNTFALLRLFMVQPMPGRTVRIEGANQIMQTDADGFFRFEYRPNSPGTPGWNPVNVELLTDNSPSATVLATGEGRVLIPFPTQYGFISDIDDTFLISHSATIVKRLQVLLTENAQSRDPFDGVVNHYQFLAKACAVEGHQNPFFYVSSSEWNLYDYIKTFAERNELPDGVFLLSQLKRLSQLLKTGQGKHHTKLDRIARILKAFPDHQFVLLGDDTQADPTIYHDVVEHYPGQIKAVYLRQVHAPHRARTRALVSQIEAAGVPCCYFAHSRDALTHSRKVLV
ncbi:MAG: App1 family protein [Rudanella sp.]|nr:App1 family protein [Rudanella sp.]